MKNIYKYIVLLLIIPAALITAQVKPGARLVYADDPEAMQIMDLDGNNLEPVLGMEVSEGTVIETYGTTAEWELIPSGSIIKLSTDTLFSLDDLQSEEETASNLTLGKGKIRAVIARLTGKDQQYNIFSGMTVCGIRGTDFVLFSEGVLVVAEGAVEMTRLQTGESVLASAGMGVDSRLEEFVARAVTPEELSFVYDDKSRFVVLDPETVPGRTDSEGDGSTRGDGDDQPLPEVDISPAPSAREGGTRTDDDREEGESRVERLLGEVLAMEAGSFTADGMIYSKLVFQPRVDLGRLQAQLYLPFIYDRDLFDPADWYKPEGNNEWSFGTDQETTEAMISDAFHDLFLKIRYVKWGSPGDPFSFNIGNYKQVTLGHGILMRNYDNNHDFPAQRKVGLYVSARAKKTGVEAVGEDLSRPTEQVVGGRLILPLLGPLSLGISGVADLSPSQDMDPNVHQSYIDRDMLFLNMALDLELPVIRRNAFSFILYADGGTMIPQTGGNLHWDYVVETAGMDMTGFRNYGATAGFMGHLFMADFQLEYLYSQGEFRHGFYNNTYDKQRGDYVIAVADYLDNPTEGEVRQGIFGNMGFDIADFVYFSAAYLWPWGKDAIDLEGDYLQVKADIGTIPLLNVSGSFVYARTGLAAAVDRGDVDFIDANTVMRGEAWVPLSKSIGLGVILSSAFERDGEGMLQYDGAGNPIPIYSLGFDVRFIY